MDFATKEPLKIDMCCCCGAYLAIEYHAVDPYSATHTALYTLATAWVKAHDHCKKPATSVCGEVVP